MSDLSANAPCNIPIFYIRCCISKNGYPVCKVMEGFIVDRASNGNGYIIETINGKRILLFPKAVYSDREIAEKYLREHEDYLVDQALIECEYRTQTNQW